MKAAQLEKLRPQVYDTNTVVFALIWLQLQSDFVSFSTSIKEQIWTRSVKKLLLKKIIIIKENVFVNEWICVEKRNAYYLLSYVSCTDVKVLIMIVMTALQAILS